jgi:hypothetical protein
MSVVFLPANNDDQPEFIDVPGIDDGLPAKLLEHYAAASGLVAADLKIEMLAIKSGDERIILFRPLHGNPVFSAANDLVNNTLNVFNPDCTVIGDVYLGAATNGVMAKFDIDKVVAIAPHLSNFHANTPYHPLETAPTKV